MDNFLGFLYYLFTTFYKDKNSLIIVLFIIFGLYFSTKLIWKTGPSILKFLGYSIGLLFIFVIFIFITLGFE